MPYATLKIARSSSITVSVVIESKTYLLNETDARSYYEGYVAAPARQAYEVNADRIRRARAVAEQRAVEQGVTWQQLSAELARDYPEPTPPSTPAFSTWWGSESRVAYVWAASLIEGAQTTGMDVASGLAGESGFPTASAMTLLDALAQQGWELHHVSESRTLIGEQGTESTAVSGIEYLLKSA